MNERQRDQFLWLWSQRRTRGASGVGWRGAWVGAAGGLLFSGILLSGMGAPATAGYTGLSAVLPWLERAATLLVMTVPTLAAVGFVNARRIFSLHEHQYQQLLQAGARVPAGPPVLTLKDRGPLIAVGVAVAVVGGFVAYVMWAASTGRL
ncbi:MAG: hypothetical protein RJA10_2418 [Pseudomonadota bacterium]|jgi:hypothetical protein